MEGLMKRYCNKCRSMQKELGKCYDCDICQKQFCIDCLKKGFMSDEMSFCEECVKDMIYPYLDKTSVAKWIKEHIKICKKENQK